MVWLSDKSTPCVNLQVQQMFVHLYTYSDALQHILNRFLNHSLQMGAIVQMATHHTQRFRLADIDQIIHYYYVGF